MIKHKDKGLLLSVSYSSHAICRIALGKLQQWLEHQELRESLR